MYQYILLDSSQQTDFYRRLDDWRVSYRSLFEGHAEEPMIDIAPLLIDVSGEYIEQEAIDREIARIGQNAPCVSMLHATCPLIELSVHLRKFHFAKTANDKMMLVRWYDTRILPVWLKILTPSQLAAFTTSITSWRSIDRFGMEQHHSLSARDGALTAKPELPLRLAEAQERFLYEQSDADSFIVSLRRSIGMELDLVHPHELYRFLSHHLEIARRHGIIERPDTAMILTLALLTSGAYAEHPLVKQRLASHTSSYSDSFKDWLLGLPDEVYESGKPLWPVEDTSE